MDFGERLAKELDLHQLSQRELARRLDITPQAITNWVQGHGRPSRDNLVRLEDLLQLPRGELLAMLGYRNPDEGDGHMVTVEEAIRLDQSIDGEDKRALLRIVAGMRRATPPLQEP